MDHQTHVDLIRQRLIEGAEVRQQALDFCEAPILQAALCLSDVFRAGGKLLLCGNGGSAADCQHVAAEFVSRLTHDFIRPGLPAIALTTDSSFLTAFANDSDFSGVFEREVQALGKVGDALIGISTSGNSANVMRAFHLAKAMQMHTIALTGASGELRNVAEIAICVPSTNTQYIQETHLAIEHILCELIENILFRMA